MKRNIVRLYIILIFWNFVNNVHSQLSNERTKTQDFIKSHSLPTAIPTAKSHKMNFQLCSPVHAIIMNAKCPANFPDREVIRKCEKGFFPLDEEDISIIVPVTNFKSNVHYANRYCATCHNDSSVSAWDLLVKCPKYLYIGGRHPNLSSKQMLSTLHFDKANNAYAISVEGQSRVCQITAIKPENISSSNSCQPSFLISECPTVYEGPKQCHQFGSEVWVCTSSAFSYVNIECARCNNVSENSIVPCFPGIPRSSSDAAQLIFKLRRDDESCSIPAVAKVYC